MGQDHGRISLWDIASAFETTLQDAEKMGDPATVAAPYELGLENVVVDYLRGIALSDATNGITGEASAHLTNSAFKLKPLKTPQRPKVPNSVFQLHMAL